MFGTINLHELHKLGVTLLILFVLLLIIKRKQSNRLLCEGVKLLLILFLAVGVIIGSNLFGETVGMKVITI